MWKNVILLELNYFSCPELCELLSIPALVLRVVILKWAVTIPCCQQALVVDQRSYALHYWLRPIEGVQFRFDNFGSHFIRVQIFQIDFSTLLLILSAYKYFRLILKRPNEHIWISVWNFHAQETFVKQFRKEKGTSWTLLNDPNIWSK